MMETNSAGYGRMSSIRSERDATAFAAAMTETELVDSMVGLYKDQYRKLNGFYPCVDRHNDVERAKTVLRNRPNGMSIMQEVANIMDFIKTMFPNESLGKLLTRYLNRNILCSGAAASVPLSTKGKQDLRVQNPREETAGAKAAAVAEGTKAPGDHEHAGEGTTARDGKVLFADVAEEYFSDPNRGRITKDISHAVERSRYRTYLEPLGSRELTSINALTVKDMLAGMHAKGCSAEDADDVFKIFCGIVTRVSDGEYGHLLDRAILDIEPAKLFVVLDGERTSEEPVITPGMPTIDKVAILEKQRPALSKLAKMRSAHGSAALSPEAGERGEVDMHLAKKIGVSRSTYASFRFVLANSDKGIIRLVREGKLSVGAARTLTTGLNKEEQHKIMQKDKKEIKAILRSMRSNNGGTDLSSVEHKKVSEEAAPGPVADIVAEKGQETRENEELRRKVMELEEKIRRLDPEENVPDPKKYISARAFYRMFHEKRKAS